MHSFIDGFGLLWFGAIKNKAATNIFAQVCLWTHGFILLGDEYLEVK